MQKLYYSIREASSEINEEPHILRYWEREFLQLKPKKNRGGNRVYSDKDIKVLKVIHILLREKKLSLKGAKEQLVKILENHDDKLNIDDIFSGNIAEKPAVSISSIDEDMAIERENLIALRGILKRTVDYLRN